MLKSIRHELQPGIFVNSLVSGSLVGAIALVSSITCGTAVFAATGNPETGIHAALISGLVLSVLIGLFGSAPGMVALPQSAVVPVMAEVVSQVVRATEGQSPETRSATVLAAVALAAFSLGVICVVMGMCNLGTIIRYMPYPVSGGFLAGLGWLLLKNGYLTSTLASNFSIEKALNPETIPFWGTALVLGFVLFFVQASKSPSWLMPGLIALLVGIFYVVFLVFIPTPIAELREAGWLIQASGTPGQGGITIPLLKQYQHIDWLTILKNAVTAATLLFTALVGLLMNVNGIETAVKEDLDPNREVLLAGVSNIASMGLGGGIVGYPAAALTGIVYQNGKPGRLASFVVSGFFALALVYGLEYVSYIPRFVLGG
jgi:SulP family sulfate permease